MKITKKKIIEYFGEERLKRSALRIGDGDKIIEKILKKEKFDTILEIGTYRGMSAAFMSQFCKRLITIDLIEGRLEQMIKEGKEPAYPTRKNVWDKFKIKNIELCLISSNVAKEKLLNNMNFDFAFIDGAHDPTVALDYELTRKCGHVLFHDYDDRGHKALNYAKDFVDSLPREELTITHLFAYWVKK